MSKIHESQINTPDVKAIFNAATGLRDNPGMLGRVFSPLRKAKVDVKDLQQAWQQDGYPDDVRDIEHILGQFGFSKKEISKVFAGVFGKDDKGSYNEPVASPQILKIAAYAKKAGLDKDLIKFMQTNYGFKESTNFHGKAVIEEVRKIFDAIIHEERSALSDMIKQDEFNRIGRNKK